MATVNLDRGRWQQYFDEMAQVSRAGEVYVESAALDIGSQVEADWLPLTGITYDPNSDVLDVVTDRLDHLINHPDTIHVDYDNLGLRNISVTDSDGRQQIIRLKEPMQLPAP